MDESHLKHSDQTNSQKPNLSEDHADQERAVIVADDEQGSDYRVNNPRKAALSKREIMEELSRERFPWEE